MAELLKRAYDIIVLKVELLNSRPNFRCTLQAKIDGRLTDIKEWLSDTSNMGLSRDSGQFSGYRDVAGSSLPFGLIDYVGAWIRDNTPGDRPLWVHLVQPYGALKFVPWERALGDALPVPILMLPDFIFPPPRESTSVLEVALCGSAPLNQEEAWVNDAMTSVSQRILDAGVRRMRLHIFADKAMVDALRNRYGGTGRLGVDVFVYGHEKAAPYLEADPSSRLVDQTGQLRSPWLLWMRDVLRGRSIDVMHFICHGYLSRDRGALLFAQSPVERTERYLAGPVGQTELATFLTQIGAWSAAFTSVQDNNSEPGLRALADEVAQSRPGPLLMNTLLADPTAAAVTDAYRFLYSVEPMDAPKSTSLFMYCQPYRVKTTEASTPRDRLWRLDDHPRASNGPQLEAAQRAGFGPSALDEIFQKQESVLPWVASTERYAEQVQLRIQQLARDQEEEGPDHSRDLRQQVAFETLSKLRESVARVASDQAASGVEEKAEGSVKRGMA